MKKAFLIFLSAAVLAALINISLISFTSLSLFSQEDHLIQDPNLRQNIENRFNLQKQLAKNREKQLFRVLDPGISLKEKEALTFLFAYMPLSDLADYNGEFYREIVKKTLEARSIFKWGSRVPPELFLHYVLPYRVNTENLDRFRLDYFDELKKRVAHLDMKEAVLEVNHWCHEKVAYRPTDSRTSGPMSTIRTAYGRCGEESTFTVSALRAVGIPARQCYTPRWAHCDDNHAWVEAWVDGKWYYLGACEPEPDLDMAWFTEPARRAMLVHTKVFGTSTGPEEIVVSDPRFSEINIIKNYAQTQNLSVTVLDKNREPVAGADVAFRLYNYAEFYPIAAKKTDTNGNCSLTSGLGDLLIWANKDDKYGYKKFSAAGTGSVAVTLDKDPNIEIIEDYDLVPPIRREPLKSSAQAKEENDRRLKEEDRIRAQYESTFMDETSARGLAASIQLDPDAVWSYIQKSRGNWKEISQFLEDSANTHSHLKKWILPLLGSISEKDLRDTPASILMDHLAHSFTYSGNLPGTLPDLFTQYVLSPRIKNELLINFRLYFQQELAGDFIAGSQVRVGKLVQWIKENIIIDDSANYYKVPLTPRGVFELKAADSNSRDIFFIALCRSLGVPARLEPGFNKPQYFDISSNRWIDVFFDTQAQPGSNPKKGFISLSYTDPAGSLVPQYYVHFTLAKFNNGRYDTLEYDEGKKVTEFPGKIEVEPGRYLLVTGNRMVNGSVLAKLRFFNVRENETRQVPVELRVSEVKPAVLGTVDLKVLLRGLKSAGGTMLDGAAMEKGLIIGFIEPGKEPTKHVMEEIQQLKEEFEKWSGAFVFVVPADKMTPSFNPIQYRLPAKHCFVACNNLFQQTVEKALGRSFGSGFPYFLAVTPGGEIIAVTEGYRIGTGELLFKTTD